MLILIIEEIEDKTLDKTMTVICLVWFQRSDSLIPFSQPRTFD